MLYSYQRSTWFHPTCPAPSPAVAQVREKLRLVFSRPAQVSERLQPCPTQKRYHLSWPRSRPSQSCQLPRQLRQPPARQLHPLPRHLSAAIEKLLSAIRGKSTISNSRHNSSSSSSSLFHPQPTATKLPTVATTAMRLILLRQLELVRWTLCSFQTSRAWSPPSPTKLFSSNSSTVFNGGWLSLVQV